MLKSGQIVKQDGSGTHMVEEIYLGQNNERWARLQVTAFKDNESLDEVVVGYIDLSEKEFYQRRVKLLTHNLWNNATKTYSPGGPYSIMIQSQRLCMEKSGRPFASIGQVILHMDNIGIRTNDGAMVQAIKSYDPFVRGF